MPIEDVFNLYDKDFGRKLAAAIASQIATEGVILNAGSATVGATTDGGPAWTTVWGVAGEAFTSADQHSAAAAVTDAPTSGKKLVITDLLVSVDTDMTVTFTEETTGKVVKKLYMAAKSVVQLTERGKIKLSTADKKLKVQTSVAGNIAVTASYYSE